MRVNDRQNCSTCLKGAGSSCERRCEGSSLPNTTECGQFGAGAKEDRMKERTQGAPSTVDCRLHIEEAARQENYSHGEGMQSVLSDRIEWEAEDGLPMIHGLGGLRVGAKALCHSVTI